MQSNCSTLKPQPQRPRVPFFYRGSHATGRSFLRPAVEHTARRGNLFEHKANLQPGSRHGRTRSSCTWDRYPRRRRGHADSDGGLSGAGECARARYSTTGSNGDPSGSWESRRPTRQIELESSPLSRTPECHVCLYRGGRGIELGCTLPWPPAGTIRERPAVAPPVAKLTEEWGIGIGISERLWATEKLSVALAAERESDGRIGSFASIKISAITVRINILIIESRATSATVENVGRKCISGSREYICNLERLIDFTTT